MLTTPISRIEEALIQLEYVLADYYTCSERNHDNTYNSLEASLYGLRILLDSALAAINRSAAKPEIVNIKNAAR
jgi:hypothetical protein